MCILIFGSTVENETDPFEGFYSLFVLNVLAGKVAAGETDFFQILREGLIVPVHADNPVNDVGPVIESVGVADEEVIFVENL